MSASLALRYIYIYVYLQTITEPETIKLCIACVHLKVTSVYVWCAVVVLGLVWVLRHEVVPC